MLYHLEKELQLNVKNTIFLVAALYTKLLNRWRLKARLT